MVRLVVGFVLAMLIARPLAAQRSPTEVLSRAVILYEELQLERAVVLLRDVASPDNGGATADERLRAMKYLGDAYALLGRRDSAVAYFQRTLERDPFTDLPAQIFTAQERQLFAVARQRTFVVGAKVPQDTGFVPGQTMVPLRFVTTRHARVHASVRRAGAAEPVASFRWTGDGAAESLWDGLDEAGGRLPPGRYLLEVGARSAPDSLADTVAVQFDVRYDHPPLEDTVGLESSSLLPERRPPSVARSRLAVGVAAAAFAIAVPTAIGHGDLGSTRKHATVMASVSVSSGVAAFVFLRRGAAIPANVRENARRREEHARLNREIRERNAARIAGARMILTPVSVEPR